MQSDQSQQRAPVIEAVAAGFVMPLAGIGRNRFHVLSPGCMETAQCSAVSILSSFFHVPAFFCLCTGPSVIFLSHVDKKQNIMV